MQTDYKETLFYEYEVGDIVTCYASWLAEDGVRTMPLIFPEYAPWDKPDGTPRDRSNIESQRCTLEIIGKLQEEQEINKTKCWGCTYTCLVHWSVNPIIISGDKVRFFLTKSRQTKLRGHNILNPGKRGAPLNPYQISNLYHKDSEGSENFNKRASTPNLEYALNQNVLCNERRLRKKRIKEYRLAANHGEDRNPQDHAGGWDYHDVEGEKQCLYQDWFYLLPETDRSAHLKMNAANSYFKMNRWTFVLHTRGTLIAWMKGTVEKLNAKKSDNLFGVNGYVTLGVQRDDCRPPPDNQPWRMPDSFDKSIEFLYNEPLYEDRFERPPLLGFFPFTAIKADSSKALNEGQSTNNTSAKVFQVVCKAFPVDTKFNEKVPIPRRTWVLTWNENDLKTGLRKPPSNREGEHYQGIDIRFIDSGDKDTAGNALNEYGEIMYTIENDFYKFQAAGEEQVFLDSRNTALRESWFNAILKLPREYYNRLWNTVTIYQQYSPNTTAPDQLGFDSLDDRGSYDMNYHPRGRHGCPKVSYHVSFGIVHKNIDIEIILPEESVFKRLFLPMTYISPDWNDKIEAYASKNNEIPAGLYGMVVRSILTRKHCSGWDPVHNRLDSFLPLCARGGYWQKWLDRVENSQNSFFYHCKAMMKALDPMVGTNNWQYDDEEAEEARLYGGPYPILSQIMEPWVLRMNPAHDALKKIMNKYAYYHSYKIYWVQELIGRLPDWAEPMFTLKNGWPAAPSGYAQPLVVKDIKLIYVSPKKTIKEYDLSGDHSQMEVGSWARPGVWRIRLNLTDKEFESVNDVANLFLTNRINGNFNYGVNKGIFSRAMHGDRLNSLIQKDEMAVRKEIILSDNELVAVPSGLTENEWKAKYNASSTDDKLKLVQATGARMLNMIRELGEAQESFEQKLYMFRQRSMNWGIDNAEAGIYPAMTDLQKHSALFKQPLRGDGILEFFNNVWPITNGIEYCPDNQTLGWFLWFSVLNGIAKDEIQEIHKDLGHYDIITKTIHSVVLYLNNDVFEQGRISLINKGVSGTAIDPQALDTYQGTFKKEIVISALSMRELSLPMNEFLKQMGFDPNELLYSQPIVRAMEREMGTHDDKMAWFNKMVRELKVDVCLMPREDTDQTLVEIFIRFAQGTHTSDVRQMTDVWVGRPKYHSFPLLTKSSTRGAQDSKFIRKIHSVHPQQWRSNTGYLHCRKLIKQNNEELYKQYQWQYEQYLHHGGEEVELDDDGGALLYDGWKSRNRGFIDSDENSWWKQPFKYTFKDGKMLEKDTPGVNVQWFVPHPAQEKGLTEHSKYDRPPTLPSIEPQWKTRCKEVYYHFIYAKKFLSIAGHEYRDFNGYNRRGYNEEVRKAILNNNLEGLPNPFILAQPYSEIDVRAPGKLADDWNNMTFERAFEEVKKDNHGKVGELLTALTLSHLHNQVQVAHDEWEKWPVECKKQYMRVTTPPDILKSTGSKPLKNFGSTFKKNLCEAMGLSNSEYDQRVKKTLFPRLPSNFQPNESVYWDVSKQKREREEEENTLQGIVVSVSMSDVSVRLPTGDVIIVRDSLLRRYKQKDIPSERDDEFLNIFSTRWAFGSEWTKFDRSKPVMFSEYDCEIKASRWGEYTRTYILKKMGVVSFISTHINRKRDKISKRLKACNKFGIDNLHVRKEQELLGLTTVQKICHRVYVAAIEKRNIFAISGKQPVILSSAFGDFSEHRDVIEYISMSIGDSQEMELFANNKYNNGVLYGKELKEVTNSDSANSTSEDYLAGIPMDMRKQKLTFTIRFKDEGASSADFCQSEQLDTLIRQKGISGSEGARRGIICAKHYEMQITKTNQWETPLCAPSMISFLNIVNKLINESKMITLDYMEDKKVVAEIDGRGSHKKDDDGNFMFKAVSLDTEQFKLAGTLAKIESVCRQLMEKGQDVAPGKQYAIKQKLDNGLDVDELEYEEALVGTPRGTTKCRICNHLGATVFLPQCTGEDKHAFHMQCIHDATLRNYGTKGKSKELIMVNLDQKMLYHQSPPPEWPRPPPHYSDAVRDAWNDWKNALDPRPWTMHGSSQYLTVRKFLELRAKMVEDKKLEPRYSTIIPLNPEEAVPCGLGNPGQVNIPYFYMCQYYSKGTQTVYGYLNEAHKNGNLNQRRLKAQQLFIGTSGGPTGQPQYRDSSGFGKEYHGRAYIGLGAAVCSCTRPYGTRIWCVTPVPEDRQTDGNTYSGQDAKEYNEYGDVKPFGIVPKIQGILDIAKYTHKYMLFKHELHGRAENFPVHAEWGRGSLELSGAYDLLIQDYAKGYNVPQFFKPIGYFPQEHEKEKIQRIEGESTSDWKVEATNGMMFRSYTIPETGESLPDITKIYKDPTIRKQLTTWLNAAEQYLLRCEREEDSDRIDSHAAERLYLIQKFKPLDGLGRPSIKLADIESKWIVKPTFRGGAIPKKYKIREQGVPPLKWRQPRTFDLDEEATIEDFLVACYDNISNKYEVPNILVLIPEFNEGVAWKPGDVYEPKVTPGEEHKARKFYPPSIVFKKVDDDNGHKGLEPKPGAYATIPIYRAPETVFTRVVYDEYHKKHVENLKKRLRKWNIVKCRDMRSGLGHTQVVDGKTVYDPSKAIFYEDMAEGMNMNAQMDELKTLCVQPLLDNVEGDALPWPNPTKIFTPTVDVQNLSGKRMASRFKVEISYVLVDNSKDTIEYVPIKIAKGPMVVDVGLDDRICSFSAQVANSQWWGKSSYYVNTKAVADAGPNNNLTTQPVFPGDGPIRTVFDVSMESAEGSNNFGPTNNYESDTWIFPVPYNQTPISLEKSDSGKKFTKPPLCPDDLQLDNDGEGRYLTWREYLIDNIDETSFDDEVIEWTPTPEEDDEIYAKMGIDNPWKCTTNYDENYVDPFSSNRYIKMVIRVPKASRFLERLRGVLWKQEEMESYNIIQPHNETLFPVKVETFDQEEGNRNRFYYPQHRPTEVWSVMPKRLLNDSLKSMPGYVYNDLMEKWANYMNFTDEDYEYTVQNQEEQQRPPHPEEYAEEDSGVGCQVHRNLYTDCYDWESRGTNDLYEPELTHKGFELAAVSIVLCKWTYRRKPDGTFYPLHRSVDDVDDLDKELEMRRMSKPYFKSTVDSRELKLKRLQAAFNVESHMELDYNDNIKLPWLHESFSRGSWCTRKRDVLLEGVNNLGNKKFANTVILPRSIIVENKGVFKCEILDRDTFYQGGIRITFEPTTIQVAHLKAKILAILESNDAPMDVKYRWGSSYRQREKLISGRGDGNGRGRGWLDDRHSYLGQSIDDTHGGYRRGGVGRSITYEDCDEDNNDKFFRTEEWIDNFYKNNDEEMEHVWTEEHVKRRECPLDVVGKSRTFIKVKVFRHVANKERRRVDPAPPLDKAIRFEFYNITGHTDEDVGPFTRKYRRSLRHVRHGFMRESKMHSLRVPGKGYQDMEWPRVFQDLKKVYILDIMYSKFLNHLKQVSLWEVFSRPKGKNTDWTKRSWETDAEMYQFLDKHITVKLVCLRPSDTYRGQLFDPVWKNPDDMGIDRFGTGVDWSENEKAMFNEKTKDGNDDVYTGEKYKPTHINLNTGMFNSALLDDIGGFSGEDKPGDEKNFSRALFTPGNMWLNGGYGRGTPIFTIAIEFSSDELDISVENVQSRMSIYEDHNLKWASTRDDRYAAWAEVIPASFKTPHIDTIVPKIGDVYATDDGDLNMVTDVSIPQMAVQQVESLKPNGDEGHAHAEWTWEKTGWDERRKLSDCYFVMRGIEMRRFAATLNPEISYLLPGNFIKLAHDPVRLKEQWDKSYGAGLQQDGSIRGRPAGARDDWPVKVMAMKALPPINMATNEERPIEWRLTLKRQDPHLSHINNVFHLDIDDRDIASGWWYIPTSKLFRETGSDITRDPRLMDESNSSEEETHVDDHGYTVDGPRPATSSSGGDYADMDLMKRIKKLRF